MQNILYRTVLIVIFCVSISLMMGLPIVHSAVQEEHTSTLLEKMARYDMMIDIGHGGVDGGTSYGNLLEKHLNLEIGKKLFTELRARGYRVGITRLHDYALSDDSSFRHVRSRHKKDLIQRSLIANELKPTLFISIHTNFSALRYVHGPVILHQRSAESYLFASLLHQELENMSPSVKSYPSRRYYLLNAIQTPSLIAEVGYISHVSERRDLQSPAYQQAIVQRMANAIDQYMMIYP